MSRSILLFLIQLTHFSKFAKDILTHGNKFYNGIQSTLDSFLDESRATEPNTNLGLILNMLYRSSSQFLIKTKKILDSFSKEIIDPIDQYRTQLKFFYEDTLLQFDKVIHISYNPIHRYAKQ